MSHFSGIHDLKQSNTIHLYTRVIIANDFLPVNI